MSIESNIQDALVDLKAEPTELASIAAEYGINPDVLAARFARAYPTGVILPEVDMASRIEEAVVAACAKWNVNRAGVIGPIKAANGRRVYVIGRNGRDVQAIDSTTGHARTMGLGNFRDALLRAQGVR